VDLASRGSATLGGTIATNAGGLRVLRYGDTRAQLLGAEAVLGSGEVVSHLVGLARDNSGYNLPALLAGSEGTLGVLTRAVVRLVPSPSGRAVAVLAFPGVAAAAAAAPLARRASSQVSAVELMLAAGVDLVASVRARRPPLAGSYPAFLLVEVETADAAPARVSGRSDDAALQALTNVVDALPGVEDAALSDTPHGRAGLWQWRESHTEAINTLGPPVKMDVTLPVPTLAEFIAKVPSVTDTAAAGSRTWLFGHAAEGSVHVNVTGATDRAAPVQDAVFGLVAAMGGSISTEHGIGVAKRRWLPLVRTPQEIAAFQRLKAALDPDGVLNPNALLPER
jgi:FAD/FMN-containing dehydrogenase